MKTTKNTILITGGGTGMGLEAAKQFSQAGNKVIMIARNEKRLKEEAAKLPNAIAIACDLSDEQSVRSLVSTLKSEYPDLNMIFLNAGIATNYSLLDGSNAYEISKQEMLTNYNSAVLLTHELAPLLAVHPESAMIITTSAVAFVPDLMHPTYSATKAALHSYILGLRLVLERNSSSIKLFELMAPLVDTPFSKAVKADYKMPASTIIDALMAGLKKDEYELHAGLTKEVFEKSQKSTQDALKFLNSVTG
ncbi:SDR family oxidoreductase [Pedobacter cryoconitis]|uniref:SDR family oxidoreductase n=1 Tax=Pedobacter cryoconitis TaxID=188932 RepID=UPI001619184D|nr:SDR family NAD(P)-dependent oxidoreductase [Pedobacter cryoconitis]MBB5645052.1 putative oxidoreductase [Pedobacter cryoconitis]